MSRMLVICLLALALALPLAGCGRKGPLELPPGQTDEYPHKYPRH